MNGYRATEDVYAHQFHFRRQRGELLWQQVHSVDLDEVMANVDTAALEKVLPNLVFGSIVTEDREELTPHHFSQLIPLSQCCLDYVLSQANTTGIMLEASMARLQAAVTDIPALTPATHALHEAITSIVLEAHHSQQQQRPYSSHFASSTAPAGAFGGGGGGRGGGGSRGGGVGHRAWASANVAEVGMPPELFAATTASLLPALEVQSRTAELHYKPALEVQSRTAELHCKPALEVQSRTAELHFKPALEVQSRTAELHFKPALEVQSRTAELHDKVDSLESDLKMERHKTDGTRFTNVTALAYSLARAIPAPEPSVVSLESDLKMERHKTDEMRRILADIRDRFNVNAPPAGGSGGGGAPTPWLQRPPGYDAGAAASIGASPFEYAAGAAGAAALGWFNGASHGTQTAGGSTVGGGTPGTSPTRFRVTVDESAIRGDERRRAMELIHMQVESLKAQVLSSRPAAGNERGRPVRSPRRTTRDASPRRERADSGERQGSQRLVRVNSTRDDGGGGGAPPSRLARHSPSLSVPIMPDVSISDALLLSPILPANAAVPSLGGSGGIPRTDSWAPSNAREAADFMRAAAAAAKPPRPPRPMSPRSTSSRVPGHTRAASEVPASVAAGGVVGEL
ncbi:hypothetical protein FOA52_011778 [Chlamydomonas sp. UWO 241]|nr:hypothetical protein FOA52_011778 [Chlamydomonas sp. UWO 241]